MKNVHELEQRITELSHHNKNRRDSLFASSDHTRDMAGSVQNGMYFGQVALSLFRNLTNYHLPMSKRVKKIGTSLLMIFLLNLIRKKIQKK